jgi:hypothetical protein
VQLRCGALIADGLADQPGARLDTGGEHHGQRAAAEHSAVRHVLIAGVLTPMPCVPVTAAPWVPGVPTVLIGNMPAVDSNCKLMCNWGGVIQVISPGQFVVMDG